MTGTGADLIIIPIVTTLSLAAWLILVAYAAVRPKWGGRSAQEHAEVNVVALPSADDAPADGQDTRHAPAA